MSDYDYNPDQDLQSHWSNASPSDSDSVAEGVLSGESTDSTDDTNDDDSLSFLDDGSDDADSDETSSEESDTDDEGKSIGGNIEQFSVPSNLKSDVIYSEKDVYRIINTLIVLESCDDTVKRWVDLTLGIGGQDVRRAMTLVKMKTSELEDKGSVISTLFTIKSVATGESGEDPVEAAFGLVAKIGDMPLDQKTSMVSLARRLNKDLGTSHRIRTAKNASDVEIVQDLRACMTGEESIADNVDALDKVINALTNASK